MGFGRAKGTLLVYRSGILPSSPLVESSIAARPLVPWHAACARSSKGKGVRLVRIGGSGHCDEESAKRCFRSPALAGILLLSFARFAQAFTQERSFYGEMKSTLE
jgi:hypothetical protein